MTTRVLVAVLIVVAILGIGWAAVLYDRNLEATMEHADKQQVYVPFRTHSPILGPQDAPVTIIEFFDPACEACRAFRPVVEHMLESFPGRVRVVLRYTAFHQGSDELIRILEAARLQGVFVPVLEAVLAALPLRAANDSPNLTKAWEAADAAGLDVPKARADIMKPGITRVLEQDMADARLIGVTRTPAFFVNNVPLHAVEAGQLYDLVEQEVGKAIIIRKK